MKRSTAAAATVALLVLASALPVQATAACLAELGPTDAPHSCCRQATSPAAPCSNHAEPTEATMASQHPCCCDHTPTAPPSPAQTASTAPTELSAAMVSPLIPVASFVPATTRTAPLADDGATDAGPPTFLLACSFLI